MTRRFLTGMIVAWVLTGVLCAMTLQTLVELVVARPQYSLRALLLFMLAVAVDLTLFAVAHAT